MGGGRGGIEAAATAETLDIPERFKVVALMACVMCLCNADRVVMSVTVVPLASKLGWSTSFLGIVQVHLFSGILFPSSLLHHPSPILDISSRVEAPASSLIIQ